MVNSFEVYTKNLNNQAARWRLSLGKFEADVTAVGELQFIKGPVVATPSCQISLQETIERRLACKPWKEDVRKVESQTEQQKIPSYKG
jgi:hypothetical protein